MNTSTDDASASTPSADADAVVDEITAKLKEYGVDEGAIAKIKDELGVTSSADLAMLTESDLTSAGLKVIQARKLIGAVAPAAPVNDASALGAAAIESILPSVPDDSSWLESLKTGGVLKTDSSTVIASVRAALANRVGLFDVPSKLVAAMEKYADESDDPVDPLYFKLREQLTRRSYGDIFSALPGMSGSYVTTPRRKELFTRIDEHLWPAIIDFYGQLKSWQEAWVQGAANPGILVASLVSAGNPGAVMPAGMLQPPETGVLRDYAEGVTDASNKVFRGDGVQIASAMAYEASEIKKSLEDPRLPALVGAANRDQMLKKLKVSVTATYPRLETSLTKFVLATLQAKDQPAGNEELQYFGALYMLGSQIPWDQLGGTHVLTGIGGTSRL